LSLGGSWFAYNESASKAIKYAHKKWVIIVIAAWNGDTALTNNGINTGTNKISPVCNETKNYEIIWVSSLSTFSDTTKNGLLSSWSNYGKCADFSAYWDNIVTTNPSWWYQIVNGTSFAAPIISGIIWLWYNTYGKVSPEWVHKALSLSINKWDGIDAQKYIKALWKIHAQEIKEKEKIIQKNISSQPKKIQKITPNNKYIKIFRAKLIPRLEEMSVKKLKNILSRIDTVLPKITDTILRKKIEALWIIIHEMIN
jgi:hypothetical protein